MLPAGLMATLSTVSSCPVQLSSIRPLVASQIRTEESSLPEINSRASEEKTTWRTSSE